MYSLFTKKPTISDIVLHVTFMALILFISFYSYYMDPSSYIVFVIAIFIALAALKTEKIILGVRSIKEILNDSTKLYDEISYACLLAIGMSFPVVVEWIKFYILVGR